MSTRITKSKARTLDMDTQHQWIYLHERAFIESPLVTGAWHEFGVRVTLEELEKIVALIKRRRAKFQDNQVPYDESFPKEQR